MKFLIFVCVSGINLFSLFVWKNMGLVYFGDFMSFLIYGIIYLF